jgi:hypothetical protein
MTKVGPLPGLLLMCAAAGCVVSRLPAPEIKPLAGEEPFLADPAPPQGDDLAPLSDEFESPGALSGWRSFSEAEGWPDQIKKIEVEASGALYIEPFTSYWLYDFHAPFLYKEISGDFVVTTRLKVTGVAGEVPAQSYSLAGLMARAPRPEGSAGWRPGEENWMFITTGSGDGEIPQIEAKNTVDSTSRLELTPGKTGWVELRMVRRGSTFLVLRRFEGEAWTAVRREEKPEMPATLQVGLIAYTDFQSSQWFFLLGRARAYKRQVLKDRKPDLIARFDWVRFRRPAGPAPQ